MIEQAILSWLALSSSLASPLPAAVETIMPSQPARTEAEVVAPRRLFAIILRSGPAWQPGKPFKDQGLGEHFRFWKAAFAEGGVVTAGPLGSDSGLVLLYAADQSDAETILNADPAIKAGIFVGQVQPYAPSMISNEPPSITRP